MPGRDPDFAAEFLARHQNKLMSGSDCPRRDTARRRCRRNRRPKQVCSERNADSAQATGSPDVFRKIV
jgi:hypothetical protein